MPNREPEMDCDGWAIAISLGEFGVPGDVEEVAGAGQGDERWYTLLD